MRRVLKHKNPHAWGLPVSRTPGSELVHLYSFEFDIWLSTTFNCFRTTKTCIWYRHFPRCFRCTWNALALDGDKPNWRTVFKQNDTVKEPTDRRLTCIGLIKSGDRSIPFVVTVEESVCRCKRKRKKKSAKELELSSKAYVWRLKTWSRNSFSEFRMPSALK